MPGCGIRLCGLATETTNFTMETYGNHKLWGLEEDFPCGYGIFCLVSTTSKLKQLLNYWITTAIQSRLHGMPWSWDVGSVVSNGGYIGYPKMPKVMIKDMAF